MSAKHCTLAVALLAAAGLTSGLTAPVLAAGKPTVSGCTEYVAPFCVGIKIKGKTYVLVDANPWIPEKTGIAAWGKPAGFMACGQKTFKVTKWSKTSRVCK
jgi:hypothetical protein